MTAEREQVGDPKGMTGCARCPWEAEGLLSDKAALREQRIEHAAGWEHLLCVVCTRSLAAGQPQTCDQCITHTRQDLAGIALLYDELPRHLGHVRSATYDGGRRGGTDGRPMPGGDLLALLGRGSQGLAEDEFTTRDHDPTSVAFELGWWVVDWQERRGETPDLRPRSARAQVHDAVAYLDRLARWAATSHPAFDQFAAELRLLHSRLEQATGRTRSPSKAGASCFDCGGTLVRKVDPHTGLEQDAVTCNRCRSRYTPARYTLALAARRTEGLAGWLSVPAAATAFRRPVRTIRTWLQRGQVAAACRADDRALLVWGPSVQELLQAMEERRREAERRRTERAAEAEKAGAPRPTRRQQAS